MRVNEQVHIHHLVFFRGIRRNLPQVHLGHVDDAFQIPVQIVAVLRCHGCDSIQIDCFPVLRILTQRQVVVLQGIRVVGPGKKTSGKDKVVVPLFCFVNLYGAQHLLHFRKAVLHSAVSACKDAVLLDQICAPAHFTLYCLHCLPLCPATARHQPPTSYFLTPD